MATKNLASVKLKRKDGEMQREVWRDGSTHEVATASFLTILQGEDGRPPFVVLADSVKEALARGGFPLDEFYLNAYIEDGTKRTGGAAKRGGGSPNRKPPSADEMFGDDNDIPF